MTKFYTQDWKTQLSKAESSDWKEVLYRFLRPLLNALARRHLKKTSITQLKPDLVLGEKGFPLIARRRWGIGGKSLNGKTVLINGTGNGWDLANWSKFRPEKIIGVDLFEFESWKEVKSFVEEKEYTSGVSFCVSPLHRL